MAKRFIPLLTLLSCTAGILAQSSSSAADQIRPLLKEQIAAANAHDTDRFLATYRHDDELVFVANGEVIRGWDKLRAQQLKWWKGGKTDVVYSEAASPEFAVLDAKTALITQQIAAHHTLPDGTSKGGMSVITTIWQKLPAGWKVIYCHESWAQ